MSEQKLLTNQPSIQNIQNPSQSCIEEYAALSPLEMKRLFKSLNFSKFQLIDLKTTNLLYKKDKGRFFITKLESWNRKIDEPDNENTNNRTQFTIHEFIYSSLKRINLMNENQMDQQLDILYKWYIGQNKKNMRYSCGRMPGKNKQNQYYEVMKTFKSNPALLIEEYHRPRLFFKNFSPHPTIQNQSPTNRNTCLNINQNKKCFNNNFLTEIQSNELRNQNNGIKKLNSEDVCELRRQSNKIRQQQLRKYLEIKEIELQQSIFKSTKSRMLSQSTKNYFDGSFNTALRAVKTSSGSRRPVKNETIESLKKMRVQTSSGKRLLNLTNQTRNSIVPELNEISNFGLLSNPFEKLKKKKKVKK